MQGWIQSKLEGGAVGSGGTEKFSKIGYESTLYTINLRSIFGINNITLR